MTLSLSLPLPGDLLHTPHDLMPYYTRPDDLLHTTLCVYTATYKVVVRNCVVDDGGTNSETEIGRQSHCGWMRQILYETGNTKVRMTGCILSCDSDGCNSASVAQWSGWMVVVLVLCLLYKLHI